DDKVALFGRAVLGNELTIVGQDAVLFLVYVGFGVGADRLFELQPLVFGEIEMRADLDLELIHEVALIGDDEFAGIQIRRAQGSDIELLGQLFEAGQEDFALDLVLNFLLEFADDDGLGRLAGAEAGDPGIADELLVFLLKDAVDVGPFDDDLDVFLARAGVLNLDGLLDLLLFLDRRRVEIGFRHGGFGSVGHDRGSLKKYSPLSLWGRGQGRG